MWKGNIVGFSVISTWLYQLQERMLDRHRLLKWMVEKLEGMKSSNEAGQYLYLQLVIKVGFLIG